MTQSQFVTALHPTYFNLFPQVGTITTRAHGIDLSKYDLFFRPSTATAQLDFVVQRISYGTTRDEKFDELVPGVMQVPIRGGYHYFSSWIDWKTQADKYLQYTAPYEYHFHVGDFEDAFNVLSKDVAKRMWNWIHYVEDRTGKPTLLYTSPSLYNDFIYPSQLTYGIDWNDVDLWTAQWFFVPNPNGTPSTPRGRTKPWKLWQYTDKGDGTKYGVARPTACDLDVYNGTVQDMMTWLRIGSDPIPQPTGTGDAMRYKVVWSAGVARRSAPTTTNSATSATPYALNTIVEVLQDNIPDASTPSDVNKRWVKFADGLYGASNYPDGTGPQVRMEKIVEPTPPSADYILHFKSDGTTQKYVPVP